MVIFFQRIKIGKVHRYNKFFCIFVEIMTKEKKILSILVIASAIFAIFAILWHNNPEYSPWMPKCWWHALTGTQCPSCGNTRAAYALLHGDWRAAWGYNPFLFLSFPLGSVIVWLWAKRPRSKWLPPLAWAFALVSAGWWIIRNL